MWSFTQTGRAISLTTPLGQDVLLLEKITGTEGISELFNFSLDVLGDPDSPLDFSKLLGQSVTMTLSPPGMDVRYFNGIVKAITAGRRMMGPEGDISFIRYQLEVVPSLWLSTLNRTSKIYQQMTVPAILTQVLTALNPTNNITGTFNARDYTVQYEESDYDFCCRLMEEEGIFFYFTHANGSHTLVLSNAPSSLPTMPGTSPVNYDEMRSGVVSDERIYEWVKTQEIRAGKYTLWDYTFQQVTNNLAATQTILPTVTAGTVSHSLTAGGNSAIEVFHWQGEFGKRYDDVDASGGDAASAFQKVFQDNTRTVGIRMQEEETPTLLIGGESNCRAMSPGYQFTLGNHYDANGTYILLRLHHAASIAGCYALTTDTPFVYRNVFQCFPSALPYAPPRKTPKPRIDGPQTAVVVGPSGDEIFTDKYSRVKVQFHWDRVGTNDANSSCWVRVGTPWAGQQWGMIHIPRIGQEVIVAFEEGDPDQPIIVGSVYNATNMPPFTLPDNKTQSGIVSRSSLKGDATMFNELRFEDLKGSEDIYFHAQKDFHREVLNNDYLEVLNYTNITLVQDRTSTITTGNEYYTISTGNRTSTITKGNENLTISQGSRNTTITQADENLILSQGNRTTTLTAGNETITIGGKETATITGDRAVTIKSGNDSLTLTTGNQTVTLSAGNQSVTLNQGNSSMTLSLGNHSIECSVGSSSITALQGITLTVGGNSIKIDSSGITLDGMMVTIQGQSAVSVQGADVTITGSASVTLAGGVITIG